MLLVKTIANIWLEWYEIFIEADMSKSLPNIDIVWLPDTAIKESKERIRAVLKNLWIELPARKIILNLAPSYIKKIWTRYDLPMALAIFLLVSDDLAWYEKILSESIFIWELWLDWSLKKVNWILPSVISAYNMWYKKYYVPLENAFELSFIKWIEIYPISNFKQLIDYFINNIKIWQYMSNLSIEDHNNETNFDLNDIKWHYFVKRALIIAACSLHNLLMIGPPWSWKTMLAKAISSILPPLSIDESLEISQIYSLMWMLNEKDHLITNRQFRHVHHTASKVSIIWWWPSLLPWQISLAHKWVLFFDELPEFSREVLESLRQPLEDKFINITRATWTVKYPASFMFVWAMNPCKCWYYKDKDNVCSCSYNEIKKYQSKLSWPLLDRFDLILEVPRENIDIILEKQIQIEKTDYKKIVYQAWERQQNRFKWTKIFLNSQMNSKDIEKYVDLDINTEEFLKNSIKLLNLSPRIIHKLLKLSLTIADIQWNDKISIDHIAQALQYRSKNYLIDI